VEAWDKVSPEGAVVCLAVHMAPIAGALERLTFPGYLVSVVQDAAGRPHQSPYLVVVVF